jgi:GNAT superfamily N-acetyltransferase
LVDVVAPDMRGQSIGGALLQYIIDAFTDSARFSTLADNCPAEREAFYKPHGFHTLFTAGDGRFLYMAGPAENPAELQALLPAPLRSLSSE